MIRRYFHNRRALALGLPAAWGLGLAGVSGLSGCAHRTGMVGQSSPPADGLSQVARFSDSPPDGQLPHGWHAYVIRRDRIPTRYETVSDDGRTVLHAISDSARTGLECTVDIDPAATPWLRWSWRVDALYPQASVADDDTEDAPARLVIAFDGDKKRLPLRDRLFFEQVELFTGKVLPYATLTYVWDGQLPVDRVLPYFRTARIQYLVAESGAGRVGRWLHYERNVAADFERAFGEPPGRITSVGLMTDSDDLKNHVEAWYGDIGLFAHR
jgi:hypothetical protein